MHAVLEPHDHHDADDQRQGRQGGGLEDLQPGGAARIHVEETDDLAGDGRTDVCADENAQRLAEGQDACADEAGGDDDRGCRGLDEGGDADAQQECLDHVVGDVLHDLFEGPGGTLLEAVAHQAHAIEEHGQAAEQCQQIKKIHDVFSDLRFSGNGTGVHQQNTRPSE